jgi:hypothetical protein
MVKQCLVCGTFNEEFAHQCVVCNAELASYISQSPLSDYSPPQTLQGVPNPFQTINGPPSLSSRYFEESWQVAESKLRLSSMSPYISTTSKGPSDDALLGPEDIQISRPPLEIEADAPAHERHNTWIGAPNPDRNTGTNVKSSIFQTDYLHGDPGTQQSSTPLAELSGIPSTVEIEVEGILEEIEPDAPPTFVGYQFGGDLLEKQRLVGREDQLSSAVSTPPLTINFGVDDANFGVDDAPPSSTPSYEEADLQRNDGHADPQGSEELVNVFNGNASNVQELPVLSQEENFAYATLESNLSPPPIIMIEDEKVIHGEGRVEWATSEPKHKPKPKPKKIKSNGTNMAQPPQETISSPPPRGWLFWVLTALFSILLGVVITLSINTLLYTQVTVNQMVQGVTYVAGRYEVSMTIETTAPITLEVPEGWLGDHQGPTLEIKGHREVKLSIPQSAIHLGDNTLALHWRHSDQELSSFSISFPVVYQLSAMSPVNMKGEYQAAVTTAEGWTLVDSNGRFKEDAPQSYSLFIPVTTRNASGQLQAELDFERSDGERRGFVEIRSAPLADMSLIIHSPPRGFARPERKIHVSGRAAPYATIEIGKTRLVTNENGVFEAMVPVKRGEQPLKIKAHADGYRSTEEVVKIERMSARRWKNKYIKLKKLGKRKSKSYPTVTYKMLKAKSQPKMGKRAMVTGRVGWVDRNHGGAYQRFLMFTCKPAGCPVWVKTKYAWWLTVGEPVRVFGVVEKMHAYPTSSGEGLTAPLLRSRLLTP